MVIPPLARAPAITKFLKPYILKMHFTNNFVSAQVIHTPSASHMLGELSGETAKAKHGVDTGRRCSGKDWEAAWRALAVQGHSCSICLHVTRSEVPWQGQGCDRLS
uniref:Uncharacterized protein n=1 Tax=Arundo donax TaxID=35708 RepID=A0A0A9D4P5_ARUDO